MSRVQSDNFYSTCNKVANPSDTPDQRYTPWARTHQTWPNVAHVLAIKVTIIFLLA